MKRIVVIGGGAAGMTFSSQVNKLMGKEIEHYVIERSPYVAWAGCPTPYYLSGRLPESALIHGSVEDFKKRGINILTNTEATDIDVKSKIVKIKKENITTELTYDILVLATGAKPILGPFAEFLKYDGVFKLTHVVDAYKIKAYLDEFKPKKAGIIGAGFIGMEIAENFKELGIEVDVFEKQDKIFPFLTESVRSDLQKLLESNGINIHLSTEIKDIKIENNRIKSVVDDKDNVYDIDILIIAMGVSANSDLAKKIGVEIGYKDGIIVDHKFRTNIDSIYAIGDAILVRHLLTKKLIHAPFGDVADKQGLILSKIIKGEDISYRGVIGTAGTAFFGTQVVTTGLNLDGAKREGYENIERVVVKGFTRNSKFEGTTPIKFEVIYDRDSDTIIGVSAIGKEAVAQFVDQFAILIINRIPVSEFIHLDFAYAPTISTVWTPILAVYRKIKK